MVIDAMTEQECAALLTRVSLGRLGCSFDDQPYVVPISFAYEPGYIYALSTLGQKIEWMRQNPLVCVEVDSVRAQNFWDSVVVFGRYEELTDKPEHELQRRQAQTVLERRALWWQTGYAALQSRGEPKAPAPVFYCIHIDEISGHKVRPDSIESSFKSTTSFVRSELQ